MIEQNPQVIPEVKPALEVKPDVSLKPVNPNIDLPVVRKISPALDEYLEARIEEALECEDFPLDDYEDLSNYLETYQND